MLSHLQCELCKCIKLDDSWHLSKPAWDTCQTQLRNVLSTLWFMGAMLQRWAWWHNINLGCRCPELCRVQSRCGQWTGLGSWLAVANWPERRWQLSVNLVQVDVPYREMGIAGIGNLYCCSGTQSNLRLKLAWSSTRLQSFTPFAILHNAKNRSQVKLPTRAVEL